MQQANTLATLTGHSDRLLSVAVGEQNSLVSCSLDCSTRIWHPRLSSLPQSDEPRNAIKADSGKHDGPVTFVAMGSGGVAVSGSRWEEFVITQNVERSVLFCLSNLYCFIYPSYVLIDFGWLIGWMMGVLYNQINIWECVQGLIEIWTIPDVSTSVCYIFSLFWAQEERMQLFFELCSISFKIKICVLMINDNKFHL